MTGGRSAKGAAKLHHTFGAPDASDGMESASAHATCSGVARLGSAATVGTLRRADNGGVGSAATTVVDGCRSGLDGSQPGKGMGGTPDCPTEERGRDGGGLALTGGVRTAD